MPEMDQEPIQAKDFLQLQLKVLNSLRLNKINNSFVIFFNRMLPHLQVDLSVENPLLYITDANEIVGIPLETIRTYKQTKKEHAKLSRLRIFDSPKSTGVENKIQQTEKHQIFTDDIKSFIKKDTSILSISK